MEYQSAVFEIKKLPDQDGLFEGYASVFSVIDQGMDVVAPGAFAKSLATGQKVKMLWQHDQRSPIGVWDEVREDATGLFVKGRLLKDVQQGREALALMTAGAIDSLSIGYRTIEATTEGNGHIRRLVEIDLKEVSLVTFPMLTAARITSVKSITTEREFEAFLRDAGYSRKEAAAITLHGFKAIEGQRDAGLDDVQSESLTAFMTQIRQLQEAIHV